MGREIPTYGPEAEAARMAKARLDPRSRALLDEAWAEMTDAVLRKTFLHCRPDEIVEMLEARHPGFAGVLQRLDMETDDLLSSWGLQEETASGRQTMR